MEQTSLVCSLCGQMNHPKAEFCQNCGQELEPVTSTSLFRLLLAHVGEVLESIFNPVFAFFKTLWLTVFRPVSFHKALLYGNPSIERVGFPLQFLWKWMFPEVRPYVLDPLEFVLTPLVLALLLGAASEMEAVFSESAEIFNQADDLAFLNPVTSSEINLITDITLNTMALGLVFVLFGVLLGAAAVYRLWLGWGRPQMKKVLTKSVYFFWFYNVGALILVFLFGRFLPLSRGWAEGEGWTRYWVPVGMTIFAFLAFWLLVVLPFFIYRSWGLGRVLGAVATSWVWLLVAYGIWRLSFGYLFVWPMAFVMVFLLLMAALPPWLWLCCLTPVVIGGISILGGYRTWQSYRVKEEGSKVEVAMSASVEDTPSPSPSPEG